MSLAGWDGEGSSPASSAACPQLMTGCSPPGPAGSPHLAPRFAALSPLSLPHFISFFFLFSSSAPFAKIPPHVPYKRHLNSLRKFPKNY